MMNGAWAHAWYCIIRILTDSLFKFFQAHTILLVQPGPKPETRTFSDYESVNECMEGRLIILGCTGW